MKEWLEYAAVWAILKALGALPRGMARGVASTIAAGLNAALPKLRRTAEFNLRLAFPEWDAARRASVVRGMVRNLGWMAAEFARMPRTTEARRAASHSGNASRKLNSAVRLSFGSAAFRPAAIVLATPRAMPRGKAPKAFKIAPHRGVLQPLLHRSPLISGATKQVSYALTYGRTNVRLPLS